MPGERDGACEAFDCAYRSPIRREAGVQAFCANAADVRTASAAWTTPMPPRPSSANRLGRGGRTPRGRIQPGGKAFQVIGKFRRYALRRASIPDMRRTTHDGRNLVYSPTLLKEYAWLSIMAAIWKFASRS